MRNANTGWALIERDLSESISDILDKVGIHYRLFSRIKEEESILEKIERKKMENAPYSIKGKKMQDIIGIRIVTYFYDDIELVKGILNHKFNFIGDSIEKLNPTEFKAKKTNIICSLDKEYFDETVRSARKDYLTLVDSTFELQLRTMLSEGWHEIEHSLRYKCKTDWDSFEEKNRMLNGIYASLETSDITLKTLFNELSYSHFKENNWHGLLRTKFRLRFKQDLINERLQQILDDDASIGKNIVKIDRDQFLLYISRSKISPPITFDNIIYFLNKYSIKNEKIEALSPSIYNEID